jgi:transcription antitermination factor NusG
VHQRIKNNAGEDRDSDAQQFDAERSSDEFQDAAQMVCAAHHRQQGTGRRRLDQDTLARHLDLLAERHQARRPWPQRSRPQLASIIPGYLFMGEHLDAGDPWPIVHDTPGIRSFVRNSTGHAASLTDDDIEIIRRIEGDENLPHDLEDRPQVQNRR